MSLIRFTPRERDFFSNVWNVQKDLNSLWSDVFSDEAVSLSKWTPSTDIIENKDNFVVHIELPGVKKEDVKITLQQNVLTISGEKKQESEAKEQDFHRVERSYGKFMRSFRLSSLVKGDAIDANYKDGILTIKLPKAEEAKPKEIEIKF